MKPIIGSKYTGPAFDRPALRQMPRDWKLEVETEWSALRVIASVAALIFCGVTIGMWVTM
jgi:hypothetical protein